MSQIETEHFDDAQELIRYLRRSESHWTSQHSWNCPWVFRGQRDATWQLRPQAWRGNQDVEARIGQLELEPRYLNWGMNSIKGNHSLLSGSSDARVERLARQLAFEHWVVHQFVGGVDDLGLPIPGGIFPREFNFSSNEVVITSDASFPPAVGLAQHHGMPTRLLDWTRNPLTAAFFAISECGEGEEGNAVVWALNFDRLPTAPVLVNVLTIPRSQIGFLHAQDALFTYATQGNIAFMRTETWPALESLVPEALRKVTVSKMAAQELRRLLWIERVSKAHLMPTLDSITSALHTTWNDVYGRPTAVRRPNGAAPTND